MSFTVASAPDSDYLQRCFWLLDFKNGFHVGFQSPLEHLYSNVIQNMKIGLVDLCTYGLRFPNLHVSNSFYQLQVTKLHVSLFERQKLVSILVEPFPIFRKIFPWFPKERLWRKCPVVKEIWESWHPPPPATERSPGNPGRKNVSYKISESKVYY